MRTVIEGEALAWLASTPAPPEASVVTSLPDVSELRLDIEAWRDWFVGAARAVIRWAPIVAIFYQSDVRHRGVWIDKSYLVLRAAEAEGASLVWRKVVCRKPPGTVALGRPSYSHMLCVSRASPLRPEGSPRRAPRPGPDVLPSAGVMPWSRAIGVEACRVACTYLQAETGTRVVVDPFCGEGTVLAVAESLGLDAIGVDLSPRRVKKARTLTIDPDVG